MRILGTESSWGILSLEYQWGLLRYSQLWTRFKFVTKCISILYYAIADVDEGGRGYQNSYPKIYPEELKSKTSTYLSLMDTPLCEISESESTRLHVL